MRVKYLKVKDGNLRENHGPIMTYGENIYFNYAY